MTGQLAAAVAGGGVAGLTAAVSLAQAGWKVRVLERASAFGEVGAGLALTANAMAALSAVGLAEAVCRAGHTDYADGFQDLAGRWLMRRPGDRADLRAIATLCGIHRQRLHAVLLQAAQSTTDIDLVTGAAVTSVRPGTAGGARAQVCWQEAGAERCAGTDLIVAADGVRSVVRAQLFPGVRPRYSGSTSWRAIVTDTSTGDRLVEMWGPGTEFGALRISPGEVYWYGYFRHPQNAVFGDELAAARDHFRDWSAQVRAMIAATSADRLLRHDVYDLGGGPPRYTCGRIVLIGDAAHAMVPTLGQGAATAVEDGVCVGQLIAAPVAAGGDMAAAMSAFDQARRPRCRQIARLSVLTGRLGCDLGGGWRQTARNRLLPLLPAAAMLKAAAPIVHWTPPSPLTAPRPRPAW